MSLKLQGQAAPLVKGVFIRMEAVGQVFIKKNCPPTELTSHHNLLIIFFGMVSDLFFHFFSIKIKMFLSIPQVRGTRPVGLHQYVQEYGLSGTGYPGTLALCQLWTE